MKSKIISKDVLVEVNETDHFPIIIESSGNIINLNFDELEGIYLYAQGTLNKEITAFEGRVGEEGTMPDLPKAPSSEILTPYNR